ncbi:MAG: hypothetical protein WDN25_22585 [Acetobacteraceae bacterium]
MIVSANWSNSSPRPDSSTRCEKLPPGDRRGRGRHVGKRAAEQAAHHQRADRGHPQHHQQRPEQRILQQRPQLRPHLHVAPDQQAEAARQVEALHHRQRLHAGALDRQLIPGAVLRGPLRPVLQVAGDPPPGRIDQQVDRIVLDVLRQPVLDRQHQGGQPAGGEPLRQALRVRLDGLRGLPVQQAGGGPPQEHRERRGADREQGGIDRREAEARRAQQALGRWDHALSARSM